MLSRTTGAAGAVPGRRRWAAIAAIAAALALIAGGITTWTQVGAKAAGTGLEITMEPSHTYIQGGGATVTYTITVNNAGDTASDPVEVSQPLPDTADRAATRVNPTGPGARYDEASETAAWSIPSLAPDAAAVLQLQVWFTGEQTAGQQIDSTATITSPDPCGSASCSASAPVIVAYFDTDSRAIVPTAEVDSVVGADGAPRSYKDHAEVGDTINFVAKTENRAAVPVDIDFDQPLSNLHGDEWDCGGALPATVEPGESLSCTLAWKVTEDDVASSTSAVVNLYPLATFPDGSWLPSVSSAVLRVSIDATADPTGGLEAGLTADSITDADGAARADGSARVGDTIAYTITLANKASAPITYAAPVTSAGMSDPECTPDPGSDLAPGETMTCTSSYVVTADDLSAGSVTATASGTGTWGSGAPGRPASTTATVTTPVLEEDAPPSATTLKVTKTAEIQGGKSTAAAGDQVTYTVFVENAGDKPTTGVTVSDPMLGDALTCDYGPEASLPPGQRFTCRGSYTVTDADVAAGGITNTATARTSDATPEASATAFVPTGGLTIEVAPTVVKAEGGTAETAKAGDMIQYQITVRNTSAFPVADVTVAAPWLSAGGYLQCTYAGTKVTAGRGLDPQESLECRGNYPVTAADEAAGKISGTIDALGQWQDPGLAASGPVTASAEVSTVVKAAAPAPTGWQLVVSKSAALIAPHSMARAGDVISYRVTVTNKGTVSAKGVKVKDPMFPLGMLCSPAGGATLKANASMSCVGVHFVTKSEVSAGGVSNTATATTTTKGVTATKATAFVPAAGLSVSHSVAVTKKSGNKSGYPQPGDTLVFTVKAKNTSAVPMTNVKVSTPFLSLTGTPLSCKVDGAAVSLPASLPAGSTLTCTTPKAGQAGAYQVTTLDAKACRIVSVATVTARWSGAGSSAGTVAPTSASLTTQVAKK